jgi:hypothetical protein
VKKIVIVIGKLDFVNKNIEILFGLFSVSNPVDIDLVKMLFTSRENSDSAKTL